MDNTADDRYVPRYALNGQKAKANGLAACVTRLRAQVKRLEDGLEIIERYTGNERHPNGVWDAHVIAGRLLRGEDHRGRSGAIKSLLRELGEGSRCTRSHPIDQFCDGCSANGGEAKS